MEPIKVGRAIRRGNRPGRHPAGRIVAGSGRADSKKVGDAGVETLASSMATRHDAPARRLLALAAFGLLAACGPDDAPAPRSPAELSAQTAPDVLEPTFVDVYVHGALDSLYSAEYERVSGICQGQPSSCWPENLDDTVVRLAPYWLAAEEGEAAGWLGSRLKTEGRWPYASLLALAEDGAEITLLESIGDWGYGLTLPVRDLRGERLQPWILADLGAWIALDGGPGLGIVEGPYGLTGRLWRFDSIVAESAASAEEVSLPEGVYMVLAVEDGTVRFRAESDQDMPCGDEMDEASPAAEPPHYEVRIEALQDERGWPRVEVAYPKGC